MSIRLVLIDDHPIVLNGLAQLLGSDPEFEVVATCGSAAEGLHAVETLKPDVLLLDLALPDEPGLSVLRRLDPSKPPAVVVLSATQDEGELLDAARLGARGIVLKAMAPRVLEECVRAVYHGAQRLVVDDEALAHRLEERRAAEADLEQILTPREMEIVRLMTMRLDNQEMASRLAISVGTVKIHLHNVYTKLRVDGRQALLEYLRAKRY
ncbi:MAG TPA: response regulator transcription factor [Vicinamibacterales bacterium]|nr:response regulator transcription factor [Vicinamibacterales bacterium]